MKIITPVIANHGDTAGREDTQKELYLKEKNLYDPKNYDSILSCAVSLLIKTIDICGFYNRVADFLDRVANHLLGNRIIDEENLKMFYPEHGITDEQLLKAYLVILNACAPKFSKNEQVR